MKGIATIADRVMPPPLHQDRTWKANGNTQDIVEAILAADDHNADQTRELAQHLRGANDMESLRNVWFFVKHNIRYVKDTPGHERVKLPAKTWADRTGDCKSMSVFIAGLLKNMGITCKYRFVSFTRGPVTHVYVVAYPNGREVILDAVAKRFDYEEPYHSKKDYMTKISMVHGLPNDKTKSRESVRMGNNRSRPIPQARYIPFSVLSEGEARLMLLDRQLDIGMAANPDRREQYRAGKDIINAVLDARLHHGGSAALAGIGSVPGYLQNVVAQAQAAVNLTQPAMRGLHSAGIGFLPKGLNYQIPWQDRWNEMKAKEARCKQINSQLNLSKKGTGLSAKQEMDLRKEMDSLQCASIPQFLEKLEFERIINTRWEDSGYGVMYHFTPGQDANKYAMVAAKKVEHGKAISNLAAITGISKTHLELMATNGIKAKGIQALPLETWKAWENGVLSERGENIGFVVELLAIVAAISGALVAFSDILKQFRPEQKVEFALPQTWDESVGPAKGDLSSGAAAGPATQGLGLAAMAAGALFLLK